MRRRHRGGAGGFAVLAALGCAGAAPAGADALEPYQMVRSLQLVQDRIAAGDHAALPMQRKLLELIDQRFHDARSQDFVDQRNYQAMLVYAMSGGNPATIDGLLVRLHLDETDRALGTGILGYLRGDPVTARDALAPVDPLQQMPELGAFLALVKGSISAAEDPKLAQRMFDEARLLSPGTLVEEAALRRSIALSSETLDAQHFLTSCSQYVRRYLQSPYAGQFADAFVAGVVALRQTIDLAAVDEIVAGMDLEQQKVIYLRLARRAAIDGYPDLTAYASAKAEAVRIEGAEPGADPRALLYSSLATITSDTVDATLARLKGIDRSRLSDSDRQLLAAAEAIAAEVTAVPRAPAGPAAAPLPVAAADAARETAPDDDLPVAEPLDATAAAGPHSAAAQDSHPAPAQDAPRVVYASAPAGEAAPAAGDAAPAAASGPAPGLGLEPAAIAAGGDGSIEADAVTPMATEIRKKLAEIDKLLGDTTQ